MLRVGPERTLSAPSDAAKTAQDGDVIEIEAGVYDSDVVVCSPTSSRSNPTCETLAPVVAALTGK